jgi:hypothetical protein
MTLDQGSKFNVFVPEVEIDYTSLGESHEHQRHARASWRLLHGSTAVDRRQATGNRQQATGTGGCGRLAECQGDLEGQEDIVRVGGK